MRLADRPKGAERTRIAVPVKPALSRDFYQRLDVIFGALADV
jgi:hypothetical protein